MPKIVNRCYCEYCGKAYEGDTYYEDAKACEESHERYMPDYVSYGDMAELMNDVTHEKYTYRDVTVAMKFRQGIAMPVALYVKSIDYKGEAKAVVYRNSNPMNVADGKLEESEE